MEYFEAEPPWGDGRCSDSNCPCSETIIPRGTGYLYISQDLVDFRRQAPTLVQAQLMLMMMQQRMSERMGGAVVILGPGVTTPILMCEMGARLKGINLRVAAADAEHWWKTGLVPLRATPPRETRYQKFSGASVEEAKKAAVAAFSEERIIDLKTIQDVRTETIMGEGASDEEAISAARARVPTEAFDRSEAEIVQPGQSDVSEIRAYSEREARRVWQQSALEGADLTHSECVLSPNKGVLGLFGRTPGVWRVYWSAPFRARIFFKLPAVITARYYF